MIELTSKEGKTMPNLTEQEFQIVTEKKKLDIARGNKTREFLKEYDALNQIGTIHPIKFIKDSKLNQKH